MNDATNEATEKIQLNQIVCQKRGNELVVENAQETTLINANEKDFVEIKLIPNTREDIKVINEDESKEK